MPPEIRASANKSEKRQEPRPFVAAGGTAAIAAAEGDKKLGTFTGRAGAGSFLKRATR